ncbi:hypothetical protein [Cognatilysobacter tabacisoli]|uniref:hypothetical protein n=1 Tax=Cognatilysobacter tabacisoli TaxID=2315424 RepID=UPI0018C8BBE7|nr:hypothetical protein [Lysobacter tabacisoli]
MKRVLLLVVLAATSCTQASSDRAAARPEQAGQPMNPVATAARIAAVRANAAVGNQAGVKREMEAFHEDFRKSIKRADPGRRVDRDAARAAARSIDGVRSVVWVDHENLLAIVEANELRSQATIDSICMALEPLGDTLGVVVNLQSGAARTGDELEVLSRNCQLAPGDRAMLQRNRQIDVIAPEVRRQHRANQRDSGDQASADAAIDVLKDSTPEM